MSLISREQCQTSSNSSQITKQEEEKEDEEEKKGRETSDVCFLILPVSKGESRLSSEAYALQIHRKVTVHKVRGSNNIASLNSLSCPTPALPLAPTAPTAPTAPRARMASSNQGPRQENTGVRMETSIQTIDSLPRQTSDLHKQSLHVCTLGSHILSNRA